ncbi:flagellar biosynthetic protein FliR [Sinobaca qinghaiensis]|uniref:Flagellar biosynthetic protein FliR n=1 Tax=Sinobaca qinghaiensis TaxID=342944 RepID=A0A419V640_9BACL|nr:flagellar biosynthetic protein FliR [Sinobaca qinghaiensis]
MEWIEQLPAYLLVLARVLAFFTTMPLFSYRNVPSYFKVGLGIFFAFFILFSIDAPAMEVDSTFVLILFKEILVGLSIGLLAGMLLYAVQTAGMFLDTSLGFLMANVIDPQTGAQTPLTGGYLYTFTLLLLLALDGHHMMLDGMFYSYNFIPMEQVTLPFGDEEVVRHIARSFALMFMIAFQMAFPVMGALFLVDIALGMMARAVPQMNVFVVGLPLKIFAGMPLLAIGLPSFYLVVENLFDQTYEAMRVLMTLLGSA